MSVSMDEPILKVEHDHTNLDIIFEDLLAIAKEATKDINDILLMDDLKKQSIYIKETLSTHFSYEESKLFSMFRRLYPLSESMFEKFISDHKRLLKKLELFHDTITKFSYSLEQKSEIETLSYEIKCLWLNHSQEEYFFLQNLSENGSIFLLGAIKPL